MIRNICIIFCLFNAFKVYAQHQKDSIITDRTHNIQEVVVYGSQVNRVNTSAYNAIAVDTRKLQNTNYSLANVLDRLSGVKVREDGGLGSNSSINLNGFMGKHVKLFIDGVPMEGSSSSFGINNIPAGFAKSIEVYKGVVPVNLGGDALGGAINIVTDTSPHKYVDASYSYGSFNTHRSNLSLGWTQKNGLMLLLNAFQNYSDNDYKVKTQWTDINTNAISDSEAWFKRFHDRYHNEAVVSQIGVVNKIWADKFVLGFTYSHEYAQIQNANLMKIVFGGKYRTAKGMTPNLLYEKRNFMFPHLDFKLSARYDMVKTNNVDTLSRTYTWTGEYKVNAYQGEGVPTLAEFRGKTLSTVANFTYYIGDKHFFTLNETYTNYHRSTTNSSANSVQNTAATFMRRINDKNILGISYKYIPEESWNMIAFAKYYKSEVSGPVNIAQTGRAEYEEKTRNTEALGWGTAGSYFLFDKKLQFKLSYERTYRLPSDIELFGDGDYEEGEASLHPEKSDNVNYNIGYKQTFDQVHTLSLNADFNYRHINDYIIRTINQKGVAVSTNHGEVQSTGVDLSAHYFYKDIFTLGGSYSLQNTRDKEKLNQIGAKSSTYNNRVPNTPYNFGGVDFSYNIKHVFGKFNSLTVGYNMSYIHKFFRSWEGDGAKLYIPEQMSHDASIIYVMNDGKYNISLEANNFTNALLYDNYSLQKPGRNFSIKFRYFLYKE